MTQHKLKIITKHQPVHSLTLLYTDCFTWSLEFSRSHILNTTSFKRSVYQFKYFLPVLCVVWSMGIECNKKLMCVYCLKPEPEYE